jgi:hypothetical protein
MTATNYSKVDKNSSNYGRAKCEEYLLLQTRWGLPFLLLQNGEKLIIKNRCIKLANYTNIDTNASEYTKLSSNPTKYT